MKRICVGGEGGGRIKETQKKRKRQLNYTKVNLQVKGKLEHSCVLSTFGAQFFLHFNKFNHKIGAKEQLKKKIEFFFFDV